MSAFICSDEHIATIAVRYTELLDGRPADAQEIANALLAINIAFATQKEAQYSADELMSRWMLVVEAGVEESDEPVNYRIDWDTREMIAVPKEVTA